MSKKWSSDTKTSPASPVRQSREENSGLIDLKALMEQAEQEQKEANQALHVSTHIGVYPFGAPPSSPTPATLTPLATAAPVVEQASFSSRFARGSRSSGRARMWGGVIAGTIIGVSAVAVAAITARGLSEKPLQVAEAALDSFVVERGWGPVRAQALAVEKAEPAKGAAAANAAGGQEPLAAGADRAAKVGQHVPKAPVMNRAPGTSSPAAPEAPAAKAPKPAAADPCNGDLMCAMQRAAKGQGSPKK